MAQRGSLLRLAAGLIRFTRLLDFNFAARSDSDLAVDDNLLTRRDTLFDNYQITLALAQRYLSLLCGRVLLDDIDIRSFRGHLRRRVGNQHSPVNRAQHQPNVHGLSGPKTMI